MSFVYRVEGNTAYTEPCAAGPWDPNLQHGGAVAALVSRVAERMSTREPMQVARLTLDLLRPVPIAPLEIDAQVVREGRKIQLCAITLLHGKVPVARASVLKVRRASLSLPETVVEEPVRLPGPEQGHPPAWPFNFEHSFVHGFNLSVVKGKFGEPGPAAIWFRAHRPIIEGEAITPLMRAVTAGDFCNGASTVLDFNQYTFINADLTVSLARLPVGEWVLLDATTWLGDAGTGIAFARLADERGYFGRAIQTLVIERRK
ncbi:MAG TPA: thioesterase family protein [Steroidobacter sp.]